MIQEAIYKGATRPAMLLGIPLVPLVVTSGLAMLLSMWGVILVSGWVVVFVAIVVTPALGWMRIVTRSDDQRLRQLVVATRLRLHDRNAYLWMARSYSPHLLRGAVDAWHA